MSLAEISIRRPVMAWMLMAAIFVFGIISFMQLGISQLPDVDFPVVSVALTLNGAAPEVMESQVLDPLEDALMEIDGIRSITSSAGQSSGQIAVEFELSRNIDQAMEEIQDKINQVQNLFPLNLQPPTLRKTNPEDSPIMWIALVAKDPNMRPIDLMIYARNTLNDVFSTLPGVGNVALGGYVAPALRVWADINKLDALDLTANDVLSAIQTQDLEIPVGTIANEKREFFIRTPGEADDPKSFGDLPIINRSGVGPVYKDVTLKDVSTIEEGITDVRRIARSNGIPTVGIGIIKQHGSNAVAVAQTVRDKVAELKKSLPPQFGLEIRSDNTRFIKQAVNELVFTLILSAILTSLVCFLFLGSWSSTLNVLLAIPTSVIGTFVAFYAFGFTLNTFTMLGLSLAIGLIVDDAIMMLENIVRHREKGLTKKKAALVGAEEITFAAMAATIAVVAIFLPVVFMDGVIGKYLMQYGITVTVAVLISLLEALTLTPMRCSRFLAVNHSGKGWSATVDRFFNKLSHLYVRILKVILNHRWKTLIFTLSLFVGSMFVSRSLPAELLPATDQSQLLLRFKLPVGSSIQLTDSSMKTIEDYLLKRPEVSSVFSVVGGFGGDAVNQGMAFVMLVDPSKRKISQMDFAKEVRPILKKLVPKMETVVQDLSLRGFASSRGFPIEFLVQGPDWDKLTDVTKQIMEAMKKEKFAVDINTDVQDGMPEVMIIPNRAKLAEHGISVTSVTSALNSLVGGAILDQDVEYQIGRHRYEIELRLVGSEREAITDLSRITIRNNRGIRIPITEIAEIKVHPSLMLISRTNRARAITVYGNPAPGHTQQEALVKTEKLAQSYLPAGYTVKMTGSSQSFRDSLISLIVAMILGILVAYMVLASQFNSFIHPITVLMALPFSFSGAFLGLALTHQTINMYSMIGFILLMGIVKKNSILLVDFTNQMREQGLQVKDALISACPVRLRPILMTSIATIAGATPEALSFGVGSEVMKPMAVAIIGGVIVSTVLTLFAVPVVYSLMAGLEYHEPQED